MKKGFTLIELLCVMTIIGLLAGFTLGAVKAYQEKQHKKQNQHLIPQEEVIPENEYPW